MEPSAAEAPQNDTEPPEDLHQLSKETDGVLDEDGNGMGGRPVWEIEWLF